MPFQVKYGSLGVSIMFVFKDYGFDNFPFFLLKSTNIWTIVCEIMLSSIASAAQWVTSIKAIWINIIYYDMIGVS